MRTTLTLDDDVAAFDPNRSGLAPKVDPHRLNQLNDQLEAEEFAADSGQ